MQKLSADPSFKNHLSILSYYLLNHPVFSQIFVGVLFRLAVLSKLKFWVLLSLAIYLSIRFTRVQKLLKFLDCKPILRKFVTILKLSHIMLGFNIASVINYTTVKPPKVQL